MNRICSLSLFILKISINIIFLFITQASEVLLSFRMLKPTIEIRRKDMIKCRFTCDFDICIHTHTYLCVCVRACDGERKKDSSDRTVRKRTWKHTDISITSFYSVITTNIPPPSKITWYWLPQHKWFLPQDNLLPSIIILICLPWVVFR